MRKRPVTSFFLILSAVFYITLIYFFLIEGSFEGAGKRMDGILASMGREAGEQVTDAVGSAEALIDDIADGPDDDPET
ncbi:MAG: hypothetical protein AAGJ29_13970 [Pseudomonadota bacterium]